MEVSKDERVGFRKSAKKTRLDDWFGDADFPNVRRRRRKLVQEAASFAVAVNEPTGNPTGQCGFHKALSDKHIYSG